MTKLATVCALMLAVSCSSQTESAAASVAVDDRWLALVDGADPGAQVHDDEPRELQLGDYAAAARPGTKLIMLVGAAGWCAPCQSEAASLSELATAYEPKGVAVLTAVFQDANAKPASLAFARQWAETFELTVPTLIDTEFKTGRYFDSDQMPATMLVDARTLSVLEIEVGADTGADPLRKYRELLDFQLAKR